MTTRETATRDGWFATGARRAADRLRFAPTPAFAVMALLTGVLGGSPQDMLCTAVHGASPLSGMMWMYVLMSACHSAPWLNLIFGRGCGAHAF